MHGRTHSWMDRWTYRWMYRWMEGQMGRGMDRHKDVHRNRWTPRFLPKWAKKGLKSTPGFYLHKRMDRQTKTDRQQDRQTDGGAYRLRDIPPSTLLSICPSNQKPMRIDLMVFSLFLTRSAVQNAHWFCCPRSLIF